MSDIKLPEGVKIDAKNEEVIALAEEPREEAKEEKPTEIDFEKIAVEERGKKKEEEEGEDEEKK